jgi:hypothetical protein
LLNKRQGFNFIFYEKQQGIAAHEIVQISPALLIFGHFVISSFRKLERLRIIMSVIKVFFYFD